MYIPKETMHGRKRLSAKQRSKRTKANVWIAVIVLVIGAAWGLWEADRAPKEATKGEEVLYHDLQTLWTWSDEQFEGGSKQASWSIRWNAAGKQGLMQEMTDEIFKDENGGMVDKLVQNEGRTVTGSVSAYGGRISISLVEAGNDSERLMLLLETDNKRPADNSLLLQAATSISQQIVQTGADFTSSMKVQGYSVSDLAISRLMRQINAQPIDRYEDGGTSSETYYTSMLQSTIDAGSGQTANMQVALHKETESEAAALTIGIPLITGDYSVDIIDEP